MKILLYGLNYAPEPVGIGKYSGEMAAWLASRGHEVRVITAPPYFPAWRVDAVYGNSYSLEHVDGVRIRRCPLWVPLHPSGLTRLLHLASFAFSSLGPLLAQRPWHPDVILTVAPAFFCAPAALLLGRLCGRNTTTVLHIQDFELDAAFELGLLKGRLLRSFAEVWEREILRSFSYVCSISSAMVRRVADKGVEKSQCFLFPNWVDLELIRPQDDSARELNPYRQELGISSDNLVLMYSGSMNKKQGLDLLVEAIHHLRDIPNILWVFAGEGPSKDDFISNTNGLSRVLHLPLQPIDRLNDWLNFADIHLLPQKSQAADLVLPSKLLGILASGRPLVTTSTPGSELFSLASQAGYCVPPDDSSSFSVALRKLILDTHLRKKLGKSARNIAEDLYGKNAILSRFESNLECFCNAPLLGG